jgi:hypothetical protein
LGSGAARAREGQDASARRLWEVLDEYARTFGRHYTHYGKRSSRFGGRRRRLPFLVFGAPRYLVASFDDSGALIVWNFEQTYSGGRP